MHKGELKIHKLYLTLAVFFSLIYNLSFAYEEEIRNLSSSIAEGVTKAGKRTIAVFEFTDLQGNITELGRFLAEELSVDLAKGFEVIDRTYLESILPEHEAFNVKAIKRLAQVAGVDAIVTGSVIPLGDSIRVSCKVIATDTARVIAATKGNILKTESIEELLKESAVAPTKPLKKLPQRVKAKKFVFELQDCKLSAQTLTCSMLITNKGKDKRLSIHARGYEQMTRLFDNLGNEYFASKVKLGSSRGDIASSTLISGIPTRANLIFKGISKKAREIAVLEIFCNRGPYASDHFTVKFRNIPLSR